MLPTFPKLFAADRRASSGVIPISRLASVFHLEVSTQLFVDVMDNLIAPEQRAESRN